MGKLMNAEGRSSKPPSRVKKIPGPAFTYNLNKPAISKAIFPRLSVVGLVIKLHLFCSPSCMFLTRSSNPSAFLLPCAID